MLKAVAPLLSLDTKLLLALYFAEKPKYTVSELMSITGLNRQGVISLMIQLRKLGMDIVYDKDDDAYILEGKPIVLTTVKILERDGERARCVVNNLLPGEIVNYTLDDDVVNIKAVIEDVTDDRIILKMLA